MTRYSNFKIGISEGQKDKPKKAFESNCDSIIILFKFSDLHGEDVIALTKSQLDGLVEAYEEKKGMTIRMSKTQISPQHENRRRIFTSVSWINSIPNCNCLAGFSSWGFISMASTGVQKLIGNGLYLKKGGSVCQIKTDGEYLAQQAVNDLKL